MMEFNYNNIDNELLRQLIRELVNEPTNIVYMATFGMLAVVLMMMLVTKIFKFIPLLHRFLGGIMSIMAMQLLLGFPIVMIMYAVDVPVLKILSCWLTLFAGNAIFMLFSFRKIKEVSVALENRKLMNQKAKK